jgi:outer membrane protein assembly factor BamD
MKSLRFLVLILLCATFSFGCSSAAKFDTSTAEGAFRAAESFEKEERYDEAITAYQEVKNKFPYSKLATQSELKIGDLQYKKEAYIEAQGAYQIFKDFHPKNPEIDYVTFRLAMSIFMQLPSSIDRDLSLSSKAITYFEEVINSYPSSQYVAEATAKRDQILHMQADKEMYVANYYFKQKIYDSALKRYETVLKNFPNLGYEPKALFGAAKSAYEIGEKERASQHAKNLLELFPNSEEAKRASSEFKHYGIN